MITPFKIALLAAALLALLVAVFVEYYVEEHRPPKSTGDAPVLSLYLDALAAPNLPQRTGPPFPGLQLDPYGAAPMRIIHRPLDADPNTHFTAELRVPPRFLESISGFESAPDGTPIANTVWMVAILPNLELRTTANRSASAGSGKQHLLGLEDVIEVFLGNVMFLGDVPDHYQRQFVQCTPQNVASDFPGLSFKPNENPADHGIGMWGACLPEDALPDGHFPVIECMKDIDTKRFRRCRVDLVLPWRLFKNPSDQQHTVRPTPGIEMIFEFPATRLPAWRRLRDISMCIAESISIDMPELTYPGRDPQLCQEIKTAILNQDKILLHAP